MGEREDGSDDRGEMGDGRWQDLCSMLTTAWESMIDCFGIKKLKTRKA